MIFFFFAPTSLVLSCVEERDLEGVKAGGRERLNGQKLGIAREELPASYQPQSIDEITGPEEERPAQVMISTFSRILIRTYSSHTPVSLSQDPTDKGQTPGSA